MSVNSQEKRNLIAQWAFDTRPILGRFHLWLEDVEIEWSKGENVKEISIEDIQSTAGQGMSLSAILFVVGSKGTEYKISQSQQYGTE